jgi:GTP pyrophosphokinase
MPGRFKDFIAMPKLNRYRSLHTTVIGPEGEPLEIQVRTREMHEEAEYGVAAHWVYKRGRAAKTDDEWLTWVKSLMDGQRDDQDPGEYMRSLRTDLFAEEVYVFTPKGEVKVLAVRRDADRLRLRRPHGRRAPNGRREGQRRIVPLHYRLRSGDFVEILTSKSGRGPSRDWLALVTSSRPATRSASGTSARRAARPRRRAVTPRPGAEGAEAPVSQAPGLDRARAGHPRDGLQEGGGLLRRARRREALADQIVNKVIQRLKTDEVAAEPSSHEAGSAPKGGVQRPRRDQRHRRARTSSFGSRSAARLFRATRSSATSRWGAGITVHREDCPNVRALQRNPKRFTPVEWEGGASAGFLVQIAVDAWDRARLLEDVARTFAEHGANIVSYGGTVEDGMAKNWYTAEVGEVKELRSLLTRSATSTPFRRLPA